MIMLNGTEPDQGRAEVAKAGMRRRERDLGIEVDAAAHDAHRREGDDEGLQLEARDDDAVDQAGGGAARDRDRERGADAELIGDAREQHSAERHHRADAEVDAAGEDHEQHAEADQAVRDHLAHQVAHVALGEEGLGEPGARKQQRDEAGDEAEVERAQARLAAGEPPSFEARLDALSLHATPPPRPRRGPESSPRSPPRA